MKARTRARVAWGIAGASVAFVGITIVYAAVRAVPMGDVTLTVTVMLATLAFGGVGALIAARTGNGVGWALLAVVGAIGVSLVAQTYATYAFLRPGTLLPFATFAAWLGQEAFLGSLVFIVAIPLLYPTGTPRWRWVWRLYVVAAIISSAGWAILPQELGLLDNEMTGPQNPFAITAWESMDGLVLGVAGLVILLCAALSVVSLVVRYRTSDGDERQQVRWLAYVGVAAAIALVLTIVLSTILGDPPPSGLPSFLQATSFMLFVWIVVFGIPAACGVAILKHRLYDLDIVVKKTVIFLLIAAGLTILSLAVLLLVPLFAVGTLTWWERSFFFVGVAIGTSFGPLRRLGRRVADRLVYGGRATPYEVLSAFSEQIGATYAGGEVTARMAQLLREATAASVARVWLAGGDFRVVAASPDDAPTIPWPADGVEVNYQGELLGGLSVEMPANDPMDATRDRLMRDLAGQAGPVLANVRLIEDLRASRQRLVSAQDEERRKIERNLHDGAQQQLVALAIKMNLVQSLAEKDPARASAMMGQVKGELQESLETLRDLARGIYPPLLADQGLAAALEAQSRKAAVPTRVEADGIARYSQETEAAAYFCCLEALQNISKYSNATRANIVLSVSEQELIFVVTDDGDGFDTSVTNYGTGMQGMADRLDAIGGRLDVESAPGMGTKVVGMLPTVGVQP